MAVYKEADIYLLDDPLSAVDTHVGKRLFEDCIEGYLKKKGVILITHQLQYLENVDQIVLLENGTISAMGSMLSLRNSGLDFTQLISPEGQKEIEEHPIRTRIRRQSSIQVELKEFVKELPDGIQAEISEGGLNMSLGQRQLICLARATIRNNKILVLDEATANVDPQTDLFIQETIRKKFADCTVLTIAHRLNTVMDSDKILVMDAGTMVEFNHPSILLKNKNGFFYKMVQETGKATAEALIKIANDNYERKQCYNNFNKEDNSVI